MTEADRERDSAALRTHLADRDLPCPACGYNLRGLPSDRCPECNQPLQLSVTLQEPHVGMLLATIIPPAAVAGAAATLVAIVAAIVARKGYPPPRVSYPLIWVPLWIALGLGPSSLWLAFPRGRTWFRRLTRQARKSTLIWSWVVTGLCFLGYTAYWLIGVF